MKIVRSGYTLVELLIVMLILSILTAGAAPRYFNALAKYRADATVKRITIDLEMARRRAQLQSTTQSVAFLAGDNRYEVASMSALDHRDSIYEFRLGDSQYGAQIISADFGGSPTLVFDIYGRPVLPGSVVVQTENGTKTIAVDAAGMITVL